MVTADDGSLLVLSKDQFALLLATLCNLNCSITSATVRSADACCFACCTGLQFFEREIQLLASIRHPNVVGFLGACHTPPNIALVTEYCARGSLDQLLHKSGLQLDLAKRVEMAMDVARGMSALHAQKPPIVHRDMKVCLKPWCAHAGYGLCTAHHTDSC